ncbi:MAG: glycosyltransferase family A protein [Candidatus Sulfobium sp.]|jgi:glycosyltransferase involved in cell wall biosynthesis
MKKRFSVIIPNYNGADTIGECLEAAFSSGHGNFEVIVVDDCSGDDSVRIVSRFPCKLVRLHKRSGAAAARNIGAQKSVGEILFFTDADCLLQPDTLSTADAAIRGREDTVLGGTYTKVPHDRDFFSFFQSAFINYSETKKKEPAYIASHAMAINRELFMKSGGFPENFLPIIEDVEFSHRLLRSGTKLEMAPGLVVQHIFRFSFLRSLANAFRKSRYWTVYSLGNGDLLSDSGTASSELKTNVVSCFASLGLGMLSLLFQKGGLLLPVPFIFALNVFANRRLLSAFYSTGGPVFFMKTAFYYMLVYPLAVGAGSVAGLLGYYSPVSSFRRKTRGQDFADNHERNGAESADGAPLQQGVRDE